MQKLRNLLLDNSLNVEIGLYFNNNWFIIPTVALQKCGKYFEINIHILCIDIYFTCNIKNINDES